MKAPTSSPNVPRHQRTERVFIRIGVDFGLTLVCFPVGGLAGDVQSHAPPEYGRRSRVRTYLTRLLLVRPPCFAELLPTGTPPSCSERVHHTQLTRRDFAKPPQIRLKSARHAGDGSRGSRKALKGHAVLSSNPLEMDTIAPTAFHKLVEGQWARGTERQIGRRRTPIPDSAAQCRV